MAKEEGEKEELAEERTDWAEDRTLMANERTYSSWTGTGLGCLGLAVGLQAVFGAVEPTWIAKLAATTFGIVAVMFFLTALVNARRTRERLETHAAEILHRQYQSTITTLLVIGTVLIIAILWLI